MTWVKANGIYYADAFDMDSKKACFVKGWDPREIPASMLAEFIADYLRTKPKQIKPRLEFNKL